MSYYAGRYHSEEHNHLSYSQFPLSKWEKPNPEHGPSNNFDHTLYTEYAATQHNITYTLICTVTLQFISIPSGELR